MKNRGIIFTGESVSGIFAGTKTQTRRIMNPQPIVTYTTPKWIYETTGGEREVYEWNGCVERANWIDTCPYGRPGDILYVKETWALRQWWHKPDGTYGWTDWPGKLPTEQPEEWEIDYRARVEAGEYRWRSSMFMPRWASRLSIRLISARAERLQEITQEDAKAEGVGQIELVQPPGEPDCILAYSLRWDEINRKRVIKGEDGRSDTCCAWGCNPWVWRLEFARVEL